MTLRITCSLVLLLGLAASGCDNTPASVDAGSDAAVGLDAHTDVDAATDASTGDDGGRDAASLADATPPDAGIDANLADAGPRTDTGVCAPAPSDLSPLGEDCSDATCPAGFTCQDYSGVILDRSCAIRCEPGGCPCPSGTSCNEVSDKTGSWHECHFLED